MNPKNFLLHGGIVLVSLGIIGMFILGPTPAQSLFGRSLWFDDVENYSHLMLGIIALGAYYLMKDHHLLKWLVAFFGVLALVTAALGFINSGSNIPNLSITHKEVSENVLNLIIAVWAFYSAFGRVKKTG